MVGCILKYKIMHVISNVFLKLVVLFKKTHYENAPFKFFLISIVFLSISISCISSNSFTSELGKISIHSKNHGWEITLDGNYLGKVRNIDYVPLGRNVIEAENSPYFPYRQEFFISYPGQTVSIVINEYKQELFEYDYVEDGRLLKSSHWLGGLLYNGEFSDSGEYISLKENGSTTKLKWKLYVKRKDRFKVGRGKYTEEFYASLFLRLDKDSKDLFLEGKDIFSLDTKKLVWENHSIDLGFRRF